MSTFPPSSPSSCSEEQLVRLLHRGRSRVWIPHLIALAVILVVFAYGATRYAGLPEMLPTGWGPSGEVRGWTNKSFGSAFSSLIIGTGMAGLLAVISALVPAMVTAPLNASAWTRLRIEGSSRGTSAGLGWVNLVMVIMFAWFTVLSWRSAQTPGQSFSSWPIAVLIVLMVVIMIPPYQYWSRWARRTAQAHGIAPTEEEAAEDRLWLPLGLYNNPDDPAVLVPKREGYGVGSTVNVGSRGGRIAVVVFCVVILVPVALILLL